MDSWKVIAVNNHSDLVAEYIFKYEDEARRFHKGMLAHGHESVCFRYNGEV